jgi:hypothetical protein
VELNLSGPDKGPDLWIDLTRAQAREVWHDASGCGESSRSRNEWTGTPKAHRAWIGRAGRCAKDTGLRNLPLALASAVLLTVQLAVRERVLLVTVVGGIGWLFSVLLLLRVIVQILRERDLSSHAVTARKHQAGMMRWRHGGSGSSGY